MTKVEVIKLIAEISEQVNGPVYMPSNENHLYTTYQEWVELDNQTLAFVKAILSLPHATQELILLAE